MANEIYTRTNQALSFARLALASWESVEGSADLGTATQLRYHREHVLFHGYRAVLALIHEVAERYRWPLLDARSVEQLVHGGLAERFPGPELGELTQLALDEDSWLAGLLRAWDQLFAPVVAPGRPATGELIASTAIPAGEWGLDEAGAALAALAALVDRYRQDMQEW